MRTILGGALALAVLAVVAVPASAAKPKLSIADVTVSEGGGEAALTVTASKRAKKAATVLFETVDDGAQAGDDYAETSGTARIKKRKRSTTLAIPILGDALDEPDEALSLRLSSPKRAKLRDPEAEVAIRDDDPEPTVTLATDALNEGTGSDPVHTITAQLSAASAKPIRVDYATANGSATASDFTATSGTLGFAPGDVSKTFSLTTTGDFGDEPDETLMIGFSNPVSVQLPGFPQTLAITDDDEACVSESLPPGQNVGTIRGDTGTDAAERSDAITPCGDTDWFFFLLDEASSSAGVDLQARVDLVSSPNGTPSSGDVDLCVRVASTPATETCSDEGPGVTETVFICVDDPVIGGTENDTTFEVEVDGFGNATNAYELTITGNVAIGTGEVLDLCP
jgi:hypothetical protein